MLINIILVLIFAGFFIVLTALYNKYDEEFARENKKLIITGLVVLVIEFFLILNLLGGLTNILTN